MPQRVFMPQVFGNADIAAQGVPSVERAVFDLMRDHPEQKRVGMNFDQRLADIAHLRVASQARHGWSGHVDLYGDGPNRWVRRLGYPLPEWYAQDDAANNIESVAHAGDGSVEGVWASWLASSGHREHVLGLNEFYRAQIQVGVGYYELAGSQYGHYWAILSAPRVGE